MSLSNYLENELMNWCFFGSDMPAAHSSVEIALHTGDPGEEGDANEIDNLSTNYSRVSVDVASSNWSKSTDGSAIVVTSDTRIDFGEAGGSWGTVTHYTIRDPSDNALRVVELDNSRTINAQDRVTFPSGAISVDID